MTYSAHHLRLKRLLKFCFQISTVLSTQLSAERWQVFFKVDTCIVYYLQALGKWDNIQLLTNEALDMM